MVQSTSLGRPPVADEGAAPQTRARAAVVVAAHGGAAATTLARLLRLSEAPATTAPCGLVVVAARGNLQGARSLEQVLPLLVAPVVVVITGDAPHPAPPAMRAALRQHVAGIEAVHHLPYVPAWRAVPATAASASRAWRRAASALQSDVSARTATPGRNRS